MFPHLPAFQAANPELWRGRSDTVNPERYFQNIQFVESEQDLISKEKKTVLIGFCSDIGITRNLGRPGASLGPNAIKTQLAKLPFPNPKPLIDLGNIVCADQNLETAQTQLAQAIHFCHQQGHNTIVLGGGHEVAWGHFQGLTNHYPKLGIINFDAHFDLRPFHPGEPGTSGTPFSQIANFCQSQQRPFQYCCIGIQKLGNTPTLFAKAKELKVNYLTAEDVFQTSLAWQTAFLDDFLIKVDHVYLTICLDVFAESAAPGVSAPQPLGLSPWQALPLLKYIMQSGKVVSFDIAELSPPLDQSEKTARLAAQIIAELLDSK